MVRYGLAILLTVTAIVSAFGAGFMRLSGDNNAQALGVLYALFSALAWALSTIGLNAVLNLFAALLAAASVGFLAAPTQVCGWQHLPLLCP